MRVKIKGSRYIDTKAIGLDGAPGKQDDGYEFDVPDAQVEAFQKCYGKPGGVYDVVAEKPAPKKSGKDKE